MRVGFLNWSKGPRITSRRSFLKSFEFFTSCFCLLPPLIVCLALITHLRLSISTSASFLWISPSRLRLLVPKQTRRLVSDRMNWSPGIRQTRIILNSESWSTRIQELKYGAGNERSRSRQRIKSYYSRAVTANTHWCIHMVTYSICTEVNPCQAMQMDTNLQSAFASRWVLKAHQLGFSHRLSWQRG